MVSRRHRPRRLLLPIVLAAALAAEITGLAIARQIVPTTPAAAPPTAPAAATAATLSTTQVGNIGVGLAGGEARRASLATGPGARAVQPGQVTRPKAPAPKPTVRPKATAPKSPSRASYHGRNHVWIPSLGINRSVSSFPCSRARPPDNYLYRWGCAGTNNVYLLGHAYSVFKPLHDAYVSGRLHRGMKVVYADGAGRVHTYSVIWWRVVAPTTAASWAWAAQSRPSMTLQTCLGSNSQYRLMVRLVRVS